MERGNRSALRIGSILLLLLALTGFVFSQRFSATPRDVSALTAEDFRDGMGLSIRDAVLLDHYASRGMGEVTAYYCALAFDIADGANAVASLEVLPGGPFYETMETFMNDKNARLGDVKLSFCATASSLDINAVEYLEDYAKRVYGSHTAYRVLPFSLVWCGDSEEEYAARMAGERGFYLKLAIPCAVLGVAGFIIGSLGRRRKHNDSKERK